MPISTRSTFAKLREGVQERFEVALRERVQASLEATPLEPGGGVEVLLFGSRARGDWDGCSDTDLLVVADTQVQADGVADALLDAGLGADVIALSRGRWQAMARGDSPHWRRIFREARPLVVHRP
ncbi:nucleotidyltransferase domain-containing protein [Cyanobium sp. ATX 6F1]|uniref:nucleotidyltransferase domain-containing protein n=1 Tax=unclassified Cyanobium TaxID=2627006 RepID=UPI0020CE8550|nr:nucleotidyltransferase domain-containing protein [Cyanobium sp. ATX 6F1]MCP9915860.1 nucleotidyltransferase domain-containing protein [Cyanobium sp. ATX 6F1]